MLWYTFPRQCFCNRYTLLSIHRCDLCMQKLTSYSRWLFPVACRKNFEWGVQQQKFTDKLLNFPEIPTNDDRLPTSDDRLPTSNDCKASFYRKTKELPTISAKRGFNTSHPTPSTLARPWLLCPILELLCLEIVYVS